MTTSLASAQVLKSHAEAVANNPAGKEYAELSSLMCWTAAIRCALNANAISSLKAQTLDRLDWSEDFSAFVSRADTRVQNAAEMRKVPVGAFIAFIRVDPPDPYFRFVNDLRGKRHILHAMVSLGNGWAAGNKNSCVGIGHHVGWELLNLADGLNWIGGRYDAINGYPLGVQKALPLRIRYRELAKFQGDDAAPVAGKNSRAARIQTLVADQTRVVKANEIWDLRPLGDSVALAAVKAGSAAGGAAAGGAAAGAAAGTASKAVFVWHVKGGSMDPDLIPCKALQAFVGDDAVDWIFVHGPGAAPPASFRSQPFYKAFVEGRSSKAGRVVRAYRGPGLLVDSGGIVMNEDQLKAQPG